MVRFKNRYITLQISPVDKADQQLNLKVTALHTAIQDKVKEFYGDYGIAAIKAGFSAKYCNTHTRIALVKARHGPHKFLLETIPSIIDVGGRHVSVKILYVGATMKHCFIFIKRYQISKLESMYSKLRTDLERKKMEEAIMTMTPAMKDFQ